MTHVSALPLAESPDPAMDACHGRPPLTPMDRDEAARIAHLLKAVADPTRLQLLGMIRDSPSGEACVCDLTAALGLTQPTISHHLKILGDAGLVVRDRRGSWVWYTVSAERLDTLRLLNDLTRLMG
ncbi:ArsR/SmtB family transcription factor [Thermomonospora umbrina]|uniref:ArsR family transcriptional regulator n=1 Tax=Thermomonospora umbrina TaxID=111806 RepID=A0A3D9SVQ0_9ACTN|nr:metalloregulator ArsR/SmtB family transcription factor [Thermomonospora umbrina]REE99888.1 ArsR family transcriptional regulator [Thermomonospora umbrina]